MALKTQFANRFALVDDAPRPAAAIGVLGLKRHTKETIDARRNVSRLDDPLAHVSTFFVALSDHLTMPQAPTGQGHRH